MRRHQEDLLEDYPSATLVQESSTIWKQTGKQMWMILVGVALGYGIWTLATHYLWKGADDQAKQVSFWGLFFLVCLIYSAIRKPLKEIQVVGPKQQYYQLNSRQDIHNWSNYQVRTLLTNWLVLTIIFSLGSMPGLVLFVLSGLVLAWSTEKAILAAAPENED